MQDVRQFAQSILDLLSNSHDEIFVTDGEGRTLWVTDACRRLYGVAPMDMVGRQAWISSGRTIFQPPVVPMALSSRKPTTMVQLSPTGKQLLVTVTPVMGPNNEITAVVGIVRELNELRREVERVSDTVFQTAFEGTLVVESPVMQRLLAQADRVAQVDSAVLILGESGVGKDELAHYIHTKSRRHQAPFVKVNCGAIPETLFESEIFGYEKGAFTGALSGGKRGLLESAHGGTLFLNEIGEMPLNLQVKLLQVLQDWSFTRLGGTSPRRVDVRVIAATNRDLSKRVREGHFREDLYWRLNVVELYVPPLRERVDDISAIAGQVLGRLNSQYGWHKEFSPGVMNLLRQYRWPGNIRELHNVVQRAAILSQGSIIDPEGLSPAMPIVVSEASADLVPALAAVGLREALHQFEHDYVARVAQRCKSSVELAKQLGISQPSAHRKLREHGIMLSQ